MLSSSAYAGSISGTYVGTGLDRVGMLQLVETATGQFVGHYEETALVAGPKLESVNMAVRGNFDGSKIVLGMARPGETDNLLLFSGSLTAGVVTLTGGSGNSSATLKLSASSVEAFNSQAAALTEKLKAMQAAQKSPQEPTRLQLANPGAPLSFSLRGFEQGSVPPR
jgi:hypothetical protein